MEIALGILSVFALALAAPGLYRLAGDATGWLVALVPLAICVYFLTFVGSVASGEVFAVVYPWVPSLGVELAFYVDGWSLLFAVLITLVGVLVLIYAGSYLHGHPLIGRFYLFILLFMGSMLGLVLADNLLLLFVFWELTSISSYFLIGFDCKREASRTAALQALLITGAGGLALLAGMVLLGQVTGGSEISGFLASGDLVRGHSLYGPILVLVLLGAFTKSAQVPFHFWLPNAMEAPTPVSAYLHSATMVKAGIYLLGRLSPVLGGTDAWVYTVTLVGAVTMVFAAWLSLRQEDLKRILAYSTISALGVLVMLLGMGTEGAAKGAAVFLFAHALYKGALFLVAGAVDHETGTRNVKLLGGLGRAMPITATAAVLAALSMAGIPPLFGFIAKEIFYEGVLHSEVAPALLTAAAVFSAIIFVNVAMVVGIYPFLSKQTGHTPKHPHEGPIGLWLGPLCLASLSLVCGLLANFLPAPLLAAASSAVAGAPLALDLSLWHGWTFTLALSALTLAGGWAVFQARHALARIAAGFRIDAPWGPQNWYAQILAGLNLTARWQTRVLQSGYLRYYLLTVIVGAVLAIGFPLTVRNEFAFDLRWSDYRFYELALAVLIILATLMAIFCSSRLGAVTALGVVGYSIALIFILFGAPDVAMTQFLIETLMVILFVSVFYFLPRYSVLSGAPARWRDAVVAISAGALMTGLTLVATAAQFQAPISDFFAEHSYPLAYGRNIVNVILVDFRALDTLGEITVLGVAGAGVFALLKLKATKAEKS
jgi:multicomponent Na+:H+ antiporter subunit A